MMRFHPASLLAAALLLGACDGPDSAARGLPTDTLVSVNDTRLWVHVEGGESGPRDGSAILVVHGGPLLDHGYLVDPLAPLTDVSPLVFYDQRLSGRSDGPPSTAPMSLGLFAEDVEALRRAMGLDRVHVLGHSWGGGIAVRYAIAYPERVRSLVLVSPPAPSFDLADREAQVQMAGLEPADTAGIGEIRASPELATLEPDAVERMIRHSFRAQLAVRDLSERLSFEIPDDYAARANALGALGPELAGYDLTSELRELQVPTLVVYGAEEAGATVGGPAWAALLPDGDVTSIEGAKHFAFLEQPAEFRRIVTEFLTGH